MAEDLGLLNHKGLSTRRETEQGIANLNRVASEIVAERVQGQ